MYIKYLFILKPQYWFHYNKKKNARIKSNIQDFTSKIISQLSAFPNVFPKEITPTTNTKRGDPFFFLC